MASLRCPLLVLALLLSAVGRSGSVSSHSMHYFSTVVSDPNQGLPQYITVAYVDDQLFVKYDSNSRKMLPQVPWIQKVVEYDAGYWGRESQREQGIEPVFRLSLGILRDRYKQNSTGLHTWQNMYGCEVSLGGGFSRGFDQYAYDGEDFITLDRETLTWTARVPQALVTKSKWEHPDVQVAQRTSAYLEDICAPWLQRYLDYGRESLLRTERPMARVERKKGYDDRETLFCQLYGFYPKEIEVTWMKDGEDRTPETLTGGVVPNSDGTYHTWLSIKVDPKEKDRYRCRVGHDSLLEPLDLAWEEPASVSNMWLIVGVLVGVLLLTSLLVGAGVTLYKRRHNRPVHGYKAPGSEQGSDNSTKVPISEA